MKLAFLISMMVAALLREGTAVTACERDSVVIDTVGATIIAAGFFGKGPGQTFVATDTLIGAITVWRMTEQSYNPYPMKLWILEVDSTGYPLSDRVIYEGPQIQVLYGDGIHPVEIRFDLDPPVALPGAGQYAFIVQNLCAGNFILLGVPDSYAQGQLWLSSRTNFSGCILSETMQSFSESDLSCKIEFCKGGPTPSRRRSWGQVKTIYR